MARIIQEKLTITFSKMVKDSDEESYVIDQAILTDIDKVLSEVGDTYSILVELGGE